MAKFDNMQSLIGNTPLVQLTKISQEIGTNLYAKLELYNPSGSVKDRVGKYMIEDAVKSGKLVSGGTIIEATAGNTGLGIAFAALEQGYKVIFVVPTKFSEEKQQLMRALGAEVINTPRKDGMLGAEKKAEKLLKHIPDAITLGQFRNQSNPKAHYETTGPEIYKEMNGNIDYIIAGAGSGGTITGIAKYVKEKNPNIKVILADPEGSTLGGGEHHDYNIEGIGNDFIAETMDISLIDQVIKVNDSEAFDGSRELARKEGIIAGSSSGAVFAAAKKLSIQLSKQLSEQTGNVNIVMVLPDRGDRYFSTGLWEGR